MPTLPRQIRLSTGGQTLQSTEDSLGRTWRLGDRVRYTGRTASVREAEGVICCIHPHTGYVGVVFSDTQLTGLHDLNGLLGGDHYGFWLYPATMDENYGINNLTFIGRGSDKIIRPDSKFAAFAKTHIPLRGLENAVS